MTYHRLAYDDAATTTEMASDARQVGRTLRVPEQPRGASSPETPAALEVSDELARIAADLELHFD